MKTPRIPTWFWETMELAGPEALQDNRDALIERFAAMPRKRLLAFFRQFLRAASHRNPLNNGFYSRDYSLSEDAGDDFAAWVVCRGKSYWTKLKTNAVFQECLDEYYNSESWTVRPDYIAGAVYEDRFGEEVFDLI